MLLTLGCRRSLDEWWSSTGTSWSLASVCGALLPPKTNKAALRARLRRCCFERTHTAHVLTGSMPVATATGKPDFIVDFYTRQQRDLPVVNADDAPYVYLNLLPATCYQYVGELLCAKVGCCVRRRATTHVCKRL